MKYTLWRIIAIAGITVLGFMGCNNPANSDQNGDTDQISVVFTALTAHGSSALTTAKLTLTFDKDIAGLTAEDISVDAGTTGAAKGGLTRTGTGIYELAVGGISSGGTVTVSVSKSGYSISGGPKQVAVYYYEEPSNIAVSFTGLTADGSLSATTSKLTLTFDKDIAGLTTEDIFVDAGTTGAIKGGLTRTETGIYELAVGGISSGGTVTVSVSKSGYTISDNPKQTGVYYYEEPSNVAVSFTGLTANGSSALTTTKLTLTFDKDISGLTAEDISVDAGTTGVAKGGLTRTGTGIYELAISGIASGGTVTVSVSKSGYSISGGSKQVAVYYYEEPSEMTINFSIETDWDTLDSSQTIQKNTSTLFTTNGNYATYQWYLDGAPVGTASNYSYDSSGTQTGDVFELAVIVTDTAGDRRSGRCRITIIN